MGNEGNPLDLTGQIPDVIVDNQLDRDPIRFIGEVNGLYQAFPGVDNLFLADRAARRVRSEQDWFEALISHAPSVGSFYEGIIRSTIEELVPSRLKLGHGFVYSTHQERSSKELDFIVYSDLDIPPLYRRHDFVVIAPSAVRAVGECKKTLSTRDLKDLVDGTMFTNLGSAYRSVGGCRHVNLFAFRAAVTTRTVVKVIRQKLEEMISKLAMRTRSGAEVTLSVRYLNLPQVFFMDRGEYIASELVWAEGVVKGVNLRVMDLGERKDSLPLFLEAMSKTEVPSTERSFLTTNLHFSTHQEFVPFQGDIYTEASIEELLHWHPDWAEQLRAATARYKEAGYALLSVRMSAQVDPHRFQTLRDLTKTPNFSVRTLPLSQ